MKKLLVLMSTLALAGCASKPVSVVVDKGLIQIDGVGTISGEHIRYRSGLLEEGEAGVTFEGDAKGYRNGDDPFNGKVPDPNE